MGLAKGDKSFYFWRCTRQCNQRGRRQQRAGVVTTTSTVWHQAVQKIQLNQNSKQQRQGFADWKTMKTLILDTTLLTDNSFLHSGLMSTWGNMLAHNAFPLGYNNECIRTPTPERLTTTYIHFVSMLIYCLGSLLQQGFFYTKQKRGIWMIVLWHSTSPDVLARKTLVRWAAVIVACEVEAATPWNSCSQCPLPAPMGGCCHLTPRKCFKPQFTFVLS